MVADEQRSAAENLFDDAECKRIRDIIPYRSVQNKQYANSFRVNPLGSVLNTTVISYKDECIIARVNRVYHAISLRSCERPILQTGCPILIPSFVAIDGVAVAAISPLPVLQSQRQKDVQTPQ